MVMPYHLHMPSYFLETFTEYPYSIRGMLTWKETEMNNPDTVVRLYRDCPFLLKFFQLLKNWFG